MIEIKSELQIHFHTITDISKYIRTIVSKYSPLVTKIEFDNVGRASERARLVMKENNAVIVLDWNILALIRPNRTESFKKSDSVNNIFFELYEEISGSNYFNGVKMSRLVLWDLLENRLPSTDVFTNHFINEKNDFSSINDISLTIEGNDEKGVEYLLIFGPFNSKKDIDKHNLTIDGYFPPSLISNEGLLVNTIISDPINTKFDKALSNGIELKKKLFNQYISL